MRVKIKTGSEKEANFKLFHRRLPIWLTHIRSTYDGRDY